MDIDEVIRRIALFPEDVQQDQAALEAFTAAAHRVDTDPREAERIRALAETVDTDTLSYDHGLAALDRGDTDTAEDLLLRAVTGELGDADVLLAELMTHAPGSAAPLSLHRRAAEARAHRAILNAAYQHHGSRPNPTHGTGHDFLRRITLRPRPGPAVTGDDLADVLMAAMEVKDPHTRQHSERISTLVVLIGQQVGMRPDRIEAARIGGLFHDIGKLAIPNTILLHAGTITEEEYELIKLHVTYGVDIVKQMPEFFDGSPDRKARRQLAEQTLAGIRHHHEKFDGTGYPLGLTAHEIPQIARAIAVADAFDAMTTTPSYRAHRTPEEALTVIRQHAGQNFDPEMVEAFLDICHTNADQIARIIQRRPPVSSQDEHKDDTITNNQKNTRTHTR